VPVPVCLQFGDLEEVEPPVTHMHAIHPIVAFLIQHRPPVQTVDDKAVKAEATKIPLPSEELLRHPPIIPMLLRPQEPCSRKLQMTVTPNLPVANAAFFTTMYSVGEQADEQAAVEISCRPCDARTSPTGFARHVGVAPFGCLL